MKQEKINGLKDLDIKGTLQVVPVSQLVKAPWNYKTDDAVKARKLTGSLRRSGQLQVLNVREVDTDDGPRLEVFDGNHRVDSLRDLGWDQVLVINAGKISRAEAIRRAMELNENRFDSDAIKVAELLRDDLTPTFTTEDLATTFPWDQQQLDDLVASLDFDMNALGVDPLINETKEQPPPEKHQRSRGPGPKMTILKMAGRSVKVTAEAAEVFWRRFDAWTNLVGDGGDPLMALLDHQGHDAGDQ